MKNTKTKRIVMLRSNGVKPDSRVEKEALALTEAGNTVTVLAWDRDSNYGEKKELLSLGDREIDITRFGIKASFGEGMKNLWPYLKFQLSMASWLIRNRKNYDCIHACDFDTGFMSSLVNRLVHKVFVFDLFDYLSTDAKSGFKMWIKKREDGIINYANAAIICTEKRKQQIADAHPKKLVIIHNSPDLLTEVPDFEIKGDANKTKIAYVGILQDYRFLHEMAEAVSEMPEVELHVGGFGKYDKYFEEMATKHSNIFFYGRLEYKKTLALENACDIMTAIYAPWIGNHKFAAPNKFYEALMLGKPALMIEGTGMSEVISEHQLGRVIPYEKDAFKAAVAELSQLTEDEKQTLSEKMRALYHEKYSWAEMKARLIKLYQEL